MDIKEKIRDRIIFYMPCDAIDCKEDIDCQKCKPMNDIAEKIMNEPILKEALELLELKRQGKLYTKSTYRYLPF